jgi:hypothetical protein
MYYDSAQFGSFEGRDNRRTIMDLFHRMGRGLSDELAGMRRAGFLQGLLNLSQNGWSQKPTIIDPCSAQDAYGMFVAITGVLGVDVTQAAVALENVVRHLE